MGELHPRITTGEKGKIITVKYRKKEKEVVRSMSQLLKELSDRHYK